MFRAMNLDHMKIVDTLEIVGDSLTQIGDLVLGVGAVFATVSVFARKTAVGRFVGWVFHRLVREPLEMHGREVVSEVVQNELKRTNGGTAFGDRLNNIEKAHVSIGERLDKGSKQVGGIQENLSELTSSCKAMAEILKEK